MGEAWAFNIDDGFGGDLVALPEADRERVKGYLRALVADPVSAKNIRKLPFPFNGRVFAASFGDILIRYERDDGARIIVFLRLFKQWET